ncbi:MAG: DDE-type integrase/transposase/recombinase [Opitutaceae bacterium]
MKTPLKSEEDPRHTRALARFAAVQAVLQERQAGQTLARALQHASEQPWDARMYTAATIEAWVYAYRHGQFGALQGKPRKDLGHCRAMDPAEVASLIKLRREYPDLTLRALAQELLRRGELEPGGFSESTLHRRLAEAGLDRHSLRMGAAVSGPTKAFEVPLPNMLWMADCMHGVPIKTEGGGQKTFLFALIDDCSRVCVHGEFYAQERLEGFLDCLRKAVQGRGLPDKLYTDNGAAFKSQQLALVCANLGIRLLHCKPYHSWSKGKIERLTPISELSVLFRDADNPELACSAKKVIEGGTSNLAASISGLSNGLKEGQQTGRLLGLPAIGRRRFGEPTQAISLHLQIGFDIAMGCGRGGMTQIQGDDFERDARLEECHRTTVPPRMRSNPAALERRAFDRGLAHRQREAKGDSVVAEWRAQAIGEDQLLRANPVVLAPLAQPPGCLSPQRDLSIPATLAVKMNGPVPKILGVQLQRFGNARACVVEQRE